MRNVFSMESGRWFIQRYEGFPVERLCNSEANFILPSPPEGGRWLPALHSPSHILDGLEFAFTLE